MNERFVKEILSPINAEIVRNFSKAAEKFVQMYCRALVAVVRAIEAKYGTEGKEIARQGFLAELTSRAEQAEAEEGKGDVQTFCENLEKACMFTHEWERVIDEKDKVAYHFTKCMWAEEFLKLGAPDIGKWLCDTDPLAAKAEKLKFQRTKTIIDGDELCDHVFYVE